MWHENKSIYGLIGYPVEHSLSPVMHNTAFEALGMDAVYKLFPLQEEELDDFFTALREKTNPIFGLNVTVPYKEKVLKYINSLSPYAQKVKAVNTIVVNPDRSLTGHNTDGPGFLSHLKELDVEIAGKRISIIGAGGVSRSIMAVICLLPEKAEWIKVFDVEKGKAEALIADLADNLLDMEKVRAVHSIDDLNIEMADILINATPIGMDPEDPMLADEELLTSKVFVYDVIYKPAETKLLKVAKKKGAKYSNGLGMLFYQGVLAFQHWAGQELEDNIKEKMRKSLEAEFKRND